MDFGQILDSKSYDQVCKYAHMHMSHNWNLTVKSQQLTVLCIKTDEKMALILWNGAKFNKSYKVGWILAIIAA